MAQYRKIPGDASGTGVTRDTRYDITAEENLYADLLEYAPEWFDPGRQPGNVVNGGGSNSADELMSEAPGFFLFTAGSTVTKTEASGRFYFTRDGSTNCTHTNAEAKIAETAGDVTWFHVIELTSGSDNHFLLAGNSFTSGYRPAIYVDTSERVRINNRASSSGGDQDETTTATNLIALNTKVIVWWSWDQSAKMMRIGTSASATALVEETWTYSLFHESGSGSAGIVFGGDSSGNGSTMKDHGHLKANVFQDDMTNSLGNNVFSDVLDNLKAIHGIT